jgi:hypothetical protein
LKSRLISIESANKPMNAASGNPYRFSVDFIVPLDRQFWMERANKG